jgi:hypothetical protein
MAAHDDDVAALRRVLDRHQIYLVVAPRPSEGLLHWASTTRAVYPWLYAPLVPFVAALCVLLMLTGRALVCLGRLGERMCGTVGWDVWAGSGRILGE